jgi:hypothetical protein
MRDAWFEWDDAKASRNLVKHEVRFDSARAVFDDPFAIERPDDEHNYGEARYIAIGVAEGRVLRVAYAVRDERIRIISARGAEPFERRLYHE